MPKFLEEKLKKEYGAKSAVPYKIMNSMGAMKGNKETAKGKAMERKHNATHGSSSSGSAYDFRKQRGRNAPARMKKA